jgi:hypothetical protein
MQYTLYWITQLAGPFPWAALNMGRGRDTVSDIAPSNDPTAYLAIPDCSGRHGNQLDRVEIVAHFFFGSF